MVIEKSNRRILGTFATRINEKGVGMKTIQRLMGRKNITTTALYCDISDQTMRNAVELV